MRHLAALAILALAPCWASAKDLPRVASVNVCTDQLVLMLADPEQIVSLSALSDAPRMSVMAGEAVKYPKNIPRAEAIAVEEPDIVVAGEFNDPAFIAMLENTGTPVETFPLTVALEDVPDEIRMMGRVLQQTERAEDVARAFEVRLSRIAEPDEEAPLAAFFFPNGYALGAGTLSHDILTAGGARNLSAELGLTGNSRLTLEQIVLHKPDFLVQAAPYAGASRSEAMAAHPVLDGIPVLNSSVNWVCAAPQLFDAVAEVEGMVARVKEERD
ncbi:ABC transporter substrate-binding protein [Marivita sp. GX14005]|uniref:ABC transporter substrate-binding protein n=1 Tax=Marivita sp. GX14005 TaxID=2942276 RepID=UPI0020193EE3|nr:ABC transporter substrate-binding protein [Marivita sp. GX14005]MCL3881891.1 ABC transporter substrate-binding protein [Marivita sp. GX14005]